MASAVKEPWWAWYASLTVSRGSGLGSHLHLGRLGVSHVEHRSSRQRQGGELPFIKERGGSRDD